MHAGVQLFKQWFPVELTLCPSDDLRKVNSGILIDWRSWLRSPVLYY